MESKSILIIEDSLYLAESLADLFTIKGHRATIAPDGRTGVKQALKEKPDLILLDIRLPDIDGYQVYRQIKDDEWGKDANVVVLTASESTDTISKNIDLPADHVLFKPDWSLQDLIAHLDTLLN